MPAVVKALAVVKLPPKVKVFPPPVRVIFEPVTVKERGVVPPETKNPSAFEVKVRALKVVPLIFP